MNSYLILFNPMLVATEHGPNLPRRSRILALTLLMFGVDRTNHHHPATAADYTAFVTHGLNGRSNFHADTIRQIYKPAIVQERGFLKQSGLEKLTARTVVAWAKTRQRDAYRLRSR